MEIRVLVDVCVTCLPLLVRMPSEDIGPERRRQCEQQSGQATHIRYLSSKRVPIAAKRATGATELRMVMHDPKRVAAAAMPQETRGTTQTRK